MMSYQWILTWYIIHQACIRFALYNYSTRSFNNVFSQYTDKEQNLGLPLTKGLILCYFVINKGIYYIHTHTHKWVYIWETNIYIYFFCELIISTLHFFPFDSQNLSLWTKTVPFKLVSKAQLSGLLVSSSIFPADGSTFSVKQVTLLWRPAEAAAESADGLASKSSAFN